MPPLPTPHSPLPIHIREAGSAQDMLLIETLERQIWGYSDDAVVGKDMLIALRFEGACIALAYHAETPIGFVLSFPTRDADTQHSHMAGVIPAYQGQGVAHALKQFQRAWCLERAINRIVWTYDPLRSRNAYFNVAKLGCTCPRYLPDFYGVMGGINAGAASDRILAEWDLRAPVGRLVAPEPDLPRLHPLERREVRLEAERFYLELPEDYGALLEHDPEMARTWRACSRPLFVDYLETHRITGFRREGGSAYLLERR